MPITTCVFDAYGTLFDVAAAARIAAAEPGRDAFAGKWPEIASTWDEALRTVSEVMCSAPVEA